MENEKTELTGGYRTDEPGSGSTGIPISSRVDPTSVMPPFDQGKAVDGMTDSEARAEWEAMTRDEKDEFRSWPRSVFLERRNKLWEKGFSKKISSEQKVRNQESRKWLEGENERIEARDVKEVEGELEERLVKYFGGEKEADAKVKSAQSLVKKYIQNPRDLQFLDDSGLGNDFEVIGMVARLNEILEEGRVRMRKGKKGGGK